MSAKFPRRPAVQAPGPWSFPTPTVTELDNGVRVVVYDVPGQHVWSVRVALPAPLAGEPRELEGVGTIMARTLDEGTQNHDVEEMAELLERRGVALGAGVGERGLIVEVDVTRRHVSGALELLAEALLRPTFPEQQVRRHVRTRLAEIDQELAHPGQRAAIAFAGAFYGSDERLGRPTGGTADTVERITRDDVAAYHAMVVRPAGSVVVVAGDIGDVDVAGEVDFALRGWGRGASPVQPAPKRPRHKRSRIVLVDRPGSVQSELYVGCFGPDRTVAGGWAPFPVLGYLLGGSPQARLDAVLREEKGYTYGVRCGFRPRRGGGLFIASGSVRTEVTAESLGLMLDILDAGRDGFEEAETEAGIAFLCHTAPGRYATADTIADEAAQRALEGLTTEHTTRVLHDMRELTPKRLRKAYRDWIDGTWTSIVVGDAGQLKKPLRALDRGDVSVLPA
ncbi:MAG: insulinase family protein [Austwickia sp.]|nr:MAG: insulinase family protein [Austwickia sp.]